MPLRLDASAADFEQRFTAFLDLKRASEADVGAAVAAILADVRTRGDAALVEYTRRFDRLDLASVPIRISADEIAKARARVSPDLIEALATAASRIEAFHRRQLPEGFDYVDDVGVGLGMRWTPVEAAGLYVPGGRAAYPSSVLMNAVPARVAGVSRLVMVVPTPDGVVNEMVLVAAELAGVDEIYRIGGAQAVAALAYGTESIRPVDKIVGPGNAYVAEAKRQVFGTVGIDLIAGPSEILIVADGESDPAWVAADLLSQAEHDPDAQAILITDSADLADRTARAVEGMLVTLPKREIAAESWKRFGAIILVPSLDQAPPLVDRLAPEHLELSVAEPDRLAARIRNAGAIFLGRHTPEAVGDYIGGPNHVLPTSRSARFSSGLGVLDFMKRTTLLRCSADNLGKLGPAAIRLAEAEGLEAHARSISIRMNTRRPASGSGA